MPERADIAALTASVNHLAELFRARFADSKEVQRNMREDIRSIKDEIKEIREKVSANGHGTILLRLDQVEKDVTSNSAKIESLQRNLYIAMGIFSAITFVLSNIGNFIDLFGN